MRVMEEGDTLIAKETRHVEVCPVCGNNEAECICCPECGHVCAHDSGGIYCPVCGPAKPEPAVMQS